MVILGTVVRSSIDQDWALIDITNQQVLSKIDSEKHKLPSHEYRLIYFTEEREVIAQTARGPLLGKSLNDPTYMRLPASQSFQKVHSVKLNDPLEYGDCGAVVCDHTKTELYGHIIASSETRDVAYIMLATHVFEALGPQWSFKNSVQKQQQSK